MNETTTAAVERNATARSTAQEQWHTAAGGWRAYAELSKARLSALVLLTTAVGFVLASASAIDWSRLAYTLLGTAAAAFGANAMNQCIERRRDALMRRTQTRPLVVGALTPRAGWTFGVLAAAGGSLLLALTVNLLTGVLALVCALIYVLAYTPLKTRSPLNTLLGAVCGAIPPMMGWTAVTGRADAGAWMLAAILFVWQIPHFLALAWMYRDDYRRGGFRMLPAQDLRGETTCLVTLLYSLALIPVTLMPVMLGVVGPWYGVGAFLLGAALVWLALRLDRDRCVANARRVFLASVMYLPLLLGLMVVDRVPRSGEFSRDSRAERNAPHAYDQVPILARELDTLAIRHFAAERMP